MELQFEKQPLECLEPVACQVRGDEQTQEVRLSDAMPDIGRVIGAWGQVLLRGKEWRNGSMTVSCGVMVWVLYAPEDGSGMQTVETWIPFQLKWDFPETKHDGVMTADCLLSAVDARSVSARKLMVRASVSAMGQALEPVQVQVSVPGAVDADVQLLRHSYPVRLVREAGEKQFAMEEELVLPSGAVPAKLVRCSLQPEVAEQKVLGSRALFRGSALVHALYMTETGECKTLDQEVSFSQFADLDREYSDDAELQVSPAVTGLELDMTEPGHPVLKAGLTGQYTVTDMTMVEVAEDAYGIGREVTPKVAALELPALLDDRRETVHLERTQSLDAQRVVDGAILASQPRLRREGDRLTMEMDGSFQLLYYGADGTLQGKAWSWEESLPLRADESSRVTAQLRQTGFLQAACGGGNVSLRTELAADTVTMAEEAIPMLTGLEIGAPLPADPDRPSLILCRAGKERLWNIAKKCGSTTDAITQANGLTGEPEEDRMLLIPVS